MVDPTFCIGDLYCGITMAHVLLWVLTFAITYGILNVLEVFGKEKGGKKVNAIVGIALATFVLLSIPATTMSVVANMSNSFVGLAVAVIVLMALLSIAGVKKEGWESYAKYIAAILALIGIAVFLGAGGLALIGIGSLPSIGLSPGIWVLALVVIAVVWLAKGENSEKKS